MSCLMRTSIQLNYVQWLHQLRQWFTITVTRLLATIAQSLSNQIHCICNRLLMTTVNVLSYWFIPWKIQFISIHLFLYWIFYYIRSIRFYCLSSFLCHSMWKCFCLHVSKHFDVNATIDSFCWNIVQANMTFCWCASIEMWRYLLLSGLVRVEVCCLLSRDKQNWIRAIGIIIHFLRALPTQQTQ